MIITSSQLSDGNSLRKIAHYQLVRKIGQGGMSSVYEAFDERLKRPIALKLLHPFLAEMPEYRSRFFREAEACARLAHPNILQIFDVASSDASPDLFIVTELLSGGTLKERRDELNAFEWPELGAMIIAQIAQALDHAHKKGIIHRDIKAENIMLTNEGQIKLMDFGIASIGNEENLTQQGTLLGSLSHIAPEVIKGQKASAQSDIFSLCTVFYWLLTEKLPFTADSPHALLKAIVEHGAQKPQLLSPYICDGLANIIERGMHKDPKERYISAEDLASAIEDRLLSMGIYQDTKRLTAFLSSPKDEITGFTKSIVSQIRKQKRVYEEKKADADAMILACRLSAADQGCGVELKKDEPGPLRLSNCLKAGSLALGLIFVLGDARFKALKVMPLKTEPVAPLDLERAPHQEAPMENAPKEPEPAPAPKIAALEIDVVIWPFATIVHNGQLVGRDKKSVHLSLKPGEHRLVFTHPYAATIEKMLIVDGSEKSRTLHVAMTKSKPAFLVIESSISADVAINGQYKGTSDKSKRHPIVIAMPDKTHALSSEVIIEKPGYEPYVLKTQFIAGQTKIIPVKLVPLISAKTN